MDSFKGSNVPLAATAAGTVHTEERGMGCNGRGNMPCAALSNTPGRRSGCEPQLSAGARHRGTPRWVSLCPQRGPAPRATAAALRAGSLHIGTAEVQNSPPHIRVDTRFHLKK